MTDRFVKQFVVIFGALFLLLGIVTLLPAATVTIFGPPGKCPDGYVLTDIGSGQARTCSQVANLSTNQTCISRFALVAGDDNVPFWMAPAASTITSIGCRCVGTCSTLATLTLEDNAGNGMTITGTNPTCATGSANATYAAVTANNGLVAGEALAFDVTNTPIGITDIYLICFTWTVN